MGRLPILHDAGQRMTSEAVRSDRVVLRNAICMSAVPVPEVLICSTTDVPGDEALIWPLAVSVTCEMLCVMAQGQDGQIAHPTWRGSEDEIGGGQV